MTDTQLGTIKCWYDYIKDDPDAPLSKIIALGHIKALIVELDRLRAELDRVAPLLARIRMAVDQED